MANQLKKICFVVSVEFAVNAFLLSHLRTLSRYYDLTLIVNTGYPDFLMDQGLSVNVVSFPLERRIRLLKDIFVLVRLYQFFKRNQFNAVHSLTPKAGFLAMMASWLARVPLRVHTFTGQVWFSKTGFSAWVLKWIDRLTSFFSTHLIVDSLSQRDFLVTKRVIKPNKSHVFGSGSVCGVDRVKFKPSQRVRKEVRKELAIPTSAFVFIFVGRITRDKGILDLIEAFVRLGHHNAYLLIVGPDEEGLLAEINARLSGVSDYFRVVGYTREVARYLAAADVFCLPSYREGFGSSVIEAAAMGLPAIASDIYGLRDAVEDGVTGLLHPPHDVTGILAHMRILMTDNEHYKRLSIKGKDRTKQQFDQKVMSQMWLDFYRNRMGELDAIRH